MHIGILETGRPPSEVSADFGTYPQIFARLLDGHGFTFSAWHVEGGEMPASVHACDGWLITGSRHGAYEDHAFIPPLEDFIRQAHGAHVPLVGVCFGHQIIAQALGGRVEKFAGGWAVGAQTYDFNGDTRRLNAWHQDQVTKAPEGARIVATNPFCAIAALRYGTHILTVQAHPEFDRAIVRRLIDARGRGVISDTLLDAAASAPDTDTGQRQTFDEIAALFRAHAPAAPSQTVQTRTAQG
ncbi:type 1 glutamine amidotransferase [Roseicitreum antarcticum]|uniref:GMP synthase-Glutamine amidotransferase n=1 Tax=Roseicitreum antarcticum TaxID=564137 RepID=A0A1H2XRH6_9RHOB|nr:type 1 glutamine amidotransferase [Roseicitreum antarcticum]SDW95437.1 GMP synthase-Glutamine amidotransferase [Roseicitreum antarcticum]